MKDYQSDADAEGVKKKKKKPQIEKTGDDSTEIEESQSPRKKKKKRHKHEETSEDNMPLEVILVTEEEGENETSQIERRKKKKHHREKTKDDDGEIENSMVERKKKKKIVEQKNDSENETSEMARKREKHKIEETRESGGTQEEDANDDILSTAKSIKGRNRHRKHRKSETEFCTKCLKTFTRQDSLRRHIRNVHMGMKVRQPEDKNHHKVQCLYCDKTFMYQGRLLEHMRIHTNESLYECAICEKKFFKKGVLKTHLLWHEKQQAKYGNKESMEKGVESDSTSGIGSRASCLSLVEQSIVSCCICKKTFPFVHELKHHLRKKGVQVVRADCGATFHSMAELAEHVCHIRYIEAENEVIEGDEIVDPQSETLSHPFLQNSLWNDLN